MGLESSKGVWRRGRPFTVAISFTRICPLYCAGLTSTNVSRVSMMTTKNMFPSLPIVFGGDVSKLESFMKNEEGMVPMVPAPCDLGKQMDGLSKKVDDLIVEVTLMR